MKKIIALSDKEFPPNHSFVDGMLICILLQERDISIVLTVSKNDIYKSCQIKKAACLALLHSRSRILRLFNIIKYYCFTLYADKKNDDKDLFKF